MQLFSIDWWLTYQQIWNQHTGIHQRFAGLGKVIFGFLNEEALTVCLEWDKTGNIINIQKVNNNEIKLPTFIASKENWQKFIVQEITAVSAVMSGKIKYKGPFALLLKYGKNFDDLARVAQQVK